MQYLPFEKPVEALAASAVALREAGGREGDAAMFDERAQRQLVDLYARLTPWQRRLFARHPERPHFRHFVDGLFDDFMPLAGDRAFADDQAILGGFASFEGRPLVIIGHAKGEDTVTRLRHNFGMAKPERVP
jgi:acetyl-CoA carboxylase carboxyl transferase subunit alpha